jgi:antitoxin VapB
MLHSGSPVRKRSNCLQEEAHGLFLPVGGGRHSRPVNARILDMAFSIKNPEADRLARQLSAMTGESLTEAVVQALRERLRRQGGRSARRRVGDELARMAAKFSKLPVRDSRKPDEILGYDEHGLPT